MQLYFLLVVVICSVTGQVPVSEFYRYGNQSGERRLPSEDDASTRIPIQFDYPFFGSIFREVHISTNGIITFGAGTTNFVPIPFPIQGTKSIATYWTDSHPGRGGTVFYRETSEPSILEQVSQEIRTRLIQYSSFTSQWALIVTFDRVSAYGCSLSLSDSCRSLCSKVVTHQAVLTSNGINSFVIFNYNKLDYTVGTASCNGHAQIGFNAGDGSRFFLVEGSNTPNIANIGLTGSNVGVSGKWIFSIDGEDISEGCNTNGLLEIIPRKVLYFGGEDIAILGPCFTINNLTITVSFEGASVICNIENGTHAICTLPLLDKLGRNSVMLSHNSVLYNSFIIAVDTDDITVKASTFEVQNTNSSLSEFTLQWNNQSDVGADVIFKGFQINYYIGQDGAILHEDTAVLNYGAHRNTGRVTFRPIDRPNPPGIIFGSIFRMILVSGLRRSERLIASHVVQIELAQNTRFARSVPVLLKGLALGPLTIILGHLHCLYWHDKQPSEQGIKDIVDEVAARAPCPPSVPGDFPKTIGNFELDSACNPSRKSSCWFFHDGALGCYRSTNNNGGPASQCCYDVTNTLILDPHKGGGTLDFEDSSESKGKHFIADVIPYISCCILGINTCNKYYEKRPSIDSRNFRPPSSGNGKGDPHFRTLDGTSYTFNPVGEFTYLTTTGGYDNIQARISQYVDQAGVRKPACYFSSFVIRSFNSDIVQVELNALKMFMFRINGQLLTFETGFWSLSGISLNYLNNSTVVLQTNSGINLEIRILSGVLHVIFTLPESFKGKISGLVGDWDGNSDNDLKRSNGTWIPVNSSNEDIHYKFGMTWSTTNETSLFTYPTGLTWFNYQNKTFLPDFSIPSPIEACNGNRDCDYDVRATGDINLGLSNIAIQSHTDAVNKQNIELSRVCPNQVAVVNGNVKVDKDSTGKTTNYLVSCNAGFELVGAGARACVDGTYYPLGTCQAKQSSSSVHGVVSVQWAIMYLILFTWITLNVS